jgi:hypothetical protein
MISSSDVGAVGILALIFAIALLVSAYRVLRGGVRRGRARKGRDEKADAIASYLRTHFDP